MELEEYQKLLDTHDWYYQYSDDYRWYKKGQAERDRLRALAETSEEFKAAYQNAASQRVAS